MTSENTDEYEYTGTGLYRPGGEYIPPGAVFVPTDSELRAFSDSLAAVEHTDAREDAETVAETASAMPVDDYDEYNVNDLRNALSGFSTDELNAALEYEHEHENRKTAITAIEDELSSRNSGGD